MDSSNYGLVKVFHPSGLLVSLPIPAATTTHDATTYDYGASFAAVKAILNAGFLVTAPGLEAGEQVKQVGYVVRRSKEGRNGIVPVIDLYEAEEGMHFAFLSVYLNTPAEVDTFLRVARLPRIESLPLYIGDNKIERGKKRDTDNLVLQVPKPFGVIFGANPKYNEAEAVAAKASGKPYQVARRKFIRWQDTGNSSTDNGDPDAIKLQPLAYALKDDPDLTAFNNLLPMFRDYPKGSELRSRAWNMMTDHAGKVGWEWDHASVSFFKVGGGF